MKTYLCMALLCLMASTAYSQILFEKGYFIENSGNRVECLIRNVDWKNNPISFRYKLSGEGEPKTAEIANVRAFGVSDYLVFERHTVAIDRRSYLASNLNQNRDPIFREEQLFLKLLVKGKAKLYGYEDGNLRRYFYTIDDGKPEQFVYTKYKSQDQKILENFYYKSQLSASMNCEAISSKEIDDTRYIEKDLQKIFENYNKCAGSEFTVYHDDRTKKLFNISIRPGVEITSMRAKYFQDNVPDTDYGNQLSLRLGAELEMLLPFNKNKWALTLEPYYRSFNAENDNDTRAEYSSIVGSLGLRHYFYLNENSKLYLNGNFGMEFPLSSDFRVATNFIKRNLEVQSGILDNNWSVGAGYNWNSKISIEARYLVTQDLLRTYEFWSADWSGVAIILGYTIL